MKRILALLLSAVMLLAVCGCGSQGGETTEATEDFAAYAYDGLSMGYSMVDITPKESTPLTGFGVSTKRWSNEIGYPLKTTAMALTGADGNTVLVLETDLITDRGLAEDMRLRISAATGVPQDHIMLGFSHTHAGPALECTNEPVIINYTKDLFNAMAQAAAEAMADRKPVDVYFGDAETQDMNFVRHYFNTAADGTRTYFGDNFGHDVEPDATAQHTSEADPTLHVVKFVREGERDLLMCNFRAHPAFDGSSKKFIVSSDYVGAYREAVDLGLDCDFMYVQGGCGNINHSSYINGETKITNAGEYAARLVEATQRAMEDMTQVTGDTVKNQQKIMIGEVNHDLDHLFLIAKDISSVWSINRDVQECLDMGRPYGIRSPFHANAIVSRYNSGETREYELDTLAIGDNLGIIVAPYEMFDTLTVYIEENAPYEKVISMCYSNNHISYLPSAYCFEYTSYETDTFPFKPGTGEVVRDTFLEMMEEMHNS